MDKILLDSDVILDLLFDRKPFSNDSALILSWCELKEIQGFVTPVIISNTYYLLRKNSPHEKVIATPHLGGLTPPAIEFQALETVAQVAEILMGKAPKGAVNAEHATRLARLRP